MLTPTKKKKKKKFKQLDSDKLQFEPQDDFLLSSELTPNLEPRVLRSLVSGWSPGETRGALEFYYRRISAVKKMQPITGQPINKFIVFVKFSKVSPGDQLLAKKPKDTVYETS